MSAHAAQFTPPSQTAVASTTPRTRASAVHGASGAPCANESAARRLPGAACQPGRYATASAARLALRLPEAGSSHSPTAPPRWAASCPRSPADSRAHDAARPEQMAESGKPPRDRSEPGRQTRRPRNRGAWSSIRSRRATSLPSPARNARAISTISTRERRARRARTAARSPILPGRRGSPNKSAVRREAHASLTPTRQRHLVGIAHAPGRRSRNPSLCIALNRGGKP